MAATASSSSGSSSDVPIALPGHIRVGDVERNATGDSCSFYRLAPAESCRRARSCADCLDAPVGSAQGCVLTSQGFCRTMSWYDPLADFRRNATGPTANHNYFPSANASYCSADDAACARCRLIANDATDTGSAAVNTSSEAARQFCVGADGCVCLVACEYARWNETAPESCPSDPFAPQEAVAAQVDSYRAYFPIFMGLQMLVLALLLYRRRAFARLRNRNRAVAEGPYNNVRAITSPSNRLRLSGWRAGREAQMNREKNPRMYLHLETPAQMHFTEELQQQHEGRSQSQESQESLEPPHASLGAESTAAGASDATRSAADPQEASEALAASLVPAETSAGASSSASSVDLKELDTLLQAKQ